MSRIIQLTMTLVVATVVGCSTAPKPDRQREELARLEPMLVSSDESDRLFSHEQLVRLCCPVRLPQDIEWLYAPACRRIEAILTTTNDATALQGLVRFGWGVECFDTINVGAVLSPLARSVVDADKLREHLYWIVAEYEPTPGMLDVVFAEYKRPPVDTHEYGFYGAARILAGLDEPGLARIHRLMTEHPASRARRLAATALSYTGSLPLDVPGLDVALEQATRDPDEHVATNARAAISDIQHNEQIGRSAAVAAALDSLDFAVLGRRRLTCSMPEVDRKLQEVAGRNGMDDNRTLTRRARLALAARRTYCRAPAEPAKAAER